MRPVRFAALVAAGAAAFACGLGATGTAAIDAGAPPEGDAATDVASEATEDARGDSSVTDADADAGDAGACACPTGFDCADGVCRDSVRDRFTLAANPSENWTFGFRFADAGSSTAITPFPVGYHDGANQIDVWSRALTSVTPAVFRNPTAATIHPFGTFTMAPGDVGFHPGQADENTVVRWSAPAPGTYHADVTLRGLSGYADSPPTTTTVTIVRQGTIIASAAIGGIGAVSSQSVAAASFALGDTIDVRVDYGSDGNFGYDSTGVDVVVYAP